MRFMIIALIALMPTVSWASCGPTIEFEAETDRGYSYGSDSRGWDNDRNRGHSLSLTLSIPLNDIECKVEEAEYYKKRAEARDRRADAMDQRLRNFEKLVRICESSDLPICAQLPRMSMELGLE